MNMEDFERRLEEWRREDLRERRREALWNFAVNMIVAIAALIVAIRAGESRRAHRRRPAEA